MKERPIIMQPESVRAILDGRKTQTRRVNKYSERMQFEVGQKLWVRETWMNAGEQIPGSEDGEIWYKANESDEYAISCEPKDCRPKWKSPLFMPRWASRINLLVKSVRVERVQNISEKDAIAEGATWTDNGPRKWLKRGLEFEEADKINVWNEGWSHKGETDKNRCFGSARMSYANLWDAINAAPKPVKTKGKITHYQSYPWSDIQETREHRGKPWHVTGNPPVRVVGFEKEQGV